MHQFGCEWTMRTRQSPGSTIFKTESHYKGFRSGPPWRPKWLPRTHFSFPPTLVWRFFLWKQVDILQKWSVTQKGSSNCDAPANATVLRMDHCHRSKYPRQTPDGQQSQVGWEAKKPTFRSDAHKGFIGLWASTKKSTQNAWRCFISVCVRVC